MEDKGQEVYETKDYPQIRVITTGGTVDKAWNFKNGKMENLAIETTVLEMLHRWYRIQPEHVEVSSVINKDSLDLDQDDLKNILEAIEAGPECCLVVHGTDTMHTTAKYIQENIQSNKLVVLTGAMIPFRYNQVEASANIASAMTYIQTTSEKKGVLIAMNGLIGRYQDVVKDQAGGYFIRRSHK